MNPTKLGSRTEDLLPSQFRVCKPACGFKHRAKDCEIEILAVILEVAPHTKTLWD